MIAKLVALVLTAAIVIIGTQLTAQAKKKGDSPGEANCKARCLNVFERRVNACVPLTDPRQCYDNANAYLANCREGCAGAEN